MANSRSTARGPAQSILIGMATSLLRTDLAHDSFSSFPPLKSSFHLNSTSYKSEQPKNEIFSTSNSSFKISVFHHMDSNFRKENQITGFHHNLDKSEISASHYFEGGFNRSTNYDELSTKISSSLLFSVNFQTSSFK